MELSFSGQDADDARLDFYDAAQALIGFQRTLALTPHLILNNEIITQAPSLKGAEILILPPAEGSWKVFAVIVPITTALGFALTADRETVLGHLVYSAYDYIISETLGFHVDFTKSLGQQYEEIHSSQSIRIPKLDETRFDSLIEKCETAIRDMHRPIVMSQTADQATINARIGRDTKTINHSLNSVTYEYIRQILTSDVEEK